MSDNNNKRSSTAGITVGPPRWGMSQAGVGARQLDPHLPGGGGGYLSICTGSDFSVLVSEKKIDPRIIELKEMGLGQRWLNIAYQIGFDNFMVVWRELDSDEFGDSGSERIRVWVPKFTRYLKFQRNRYILFRANDPDTTPEHIQKEIRKMLGESLSVPHIKRVMEKVNIEE